MSADKYPSIFSKSNGGYGVYYHSNIFDITRNFKKIGENINNRLYLARKYGRIFVLGLKVAEHSFRARFCTRISKTNKQLIQRSFYFSIPALCMLIFSIIESSVLMPLNFYYKDTWQKLCQNYSREELYHRSLAVAAFASVRARKYLSIGFIFRISETLMVFRGW